MLLSLRPIARGLLLHTLCVRVRSAPVQRAWTGDAIRGETSELIQNTTLKITVRGNAVSPARPGAGDASLGAARALSVVCGQLEPCLGLRQGRGLARFVNPCWYWSGSTSIPPVPGRAATGSTNVYPLYKWPPCCGLHAQMATVLSLSRCRSRAERETGPQYDTVARNVETEGGP